MKTQSSSIDKFAMVVRKVFIALGQQSSHKQGIIMTERQLRRAARFLKKPCAVIDRDGTHAGRQRPKAGSQNLEPDQQISTTATDVFQQ